MVRGAEGRARPRRPKGSAHTARGSPAAGFTPCSPALPHSFTNVHIVYRTVSGNARFRSLNASAAAASDPPPEPSPPPPRRPPIPPQRLGNLAPDILPPVVITHDGSRVHVPAELHRVAPPPALIQGLGHGLVPQTVGAHGARQSRTLREGLDQV